MTDTNNALKKYTEFFSFLSFFLLSDDVDSPPHPLVCQPVDTAVNRNFSRVHYCTLWLLGSPKAAS